MIMRVCTCCGEELGEKHELGPTYAKVKIHHTYCIFCSAEMYNQLGIPVEKLDIVFKDIHGNETVTPRLLEALLYPPETLRKEINKRCREWPGQFFIRIHNPRDI